MRKILVIIPTYNEAKNISILIEKIINLNIPNLSILVIDDNSPDRTWEVVEKIASEDSRVNLLKRPSKLGLGTAYVEGFKYALNHHYDYIFEMDADLSHDPNEIKNFLEKIKECDLVIGSRYVTGVNVINWPLSRLILSVGANWYTRMITGMPIKDCTSGFKCFRRKVLESIDLDHISSDGYAFQIEMNYKAWKKNFRICEIPIIFVDRAQGSSKMSRKVMLEAVWMVWKLRLLGLLGKIK
ncbi:MAG: polyprenol monophosphomannose synthase [Calditrichaeota bacterium]|nr:MAG: polyprenol monophosphomannose synthase [Calditrichota bacterium]